MSGHGYKKKWLRASKALEYYIVEGPWSGGWTDAEWQLYMAVIEGECRCRHNFKLVEDPSIFAGKSYNDERLYVLPFDLEVSLEDVHRIWNWAAYDMADVIARGKLSSAVANIQSETIILNLHVLINRLGARLSAMSLAEAKSEIDFKARWLSLERNLNFILGARLLDAETLQNRQTGFKEVSLRLKSMAKANFKPKSKRGRKPKYNWQAVKSHIFEKFEYHGLLSPDDLEWSCQADVEKAIKAFCQSQLGQEPATSLAREKAKLFISEFMAIK